MTPRGSGLKELPAPPEQDPPLPEKKSLLARALLELLARRFSRSIDRSIIKELDRLIALSEEPFIQQRSSKHLAKLAYSIYFIRRSLSRAIALFPFEEHFDIRLFRAPLQFTFGTKSILGVLTHAHLKDKHEILNEEQILLSIRRLFPDIQLVKDSLYAFQSQSSTLKTLYFEIDRKSGIPFSAEDVKQLTKHLKPEIQFSVEQLVPRIFMLRNEEEILKNILTLSREIHSPPDLPQVMIIFDSQTAQEVFFTLIVVRIMKKPLPALQDHFAQISSVEYLPERCQIVRYLRKKYPVEATVFRLKLPKETSLLRNDLSLNYYLARQKISQLLTEAIGEFRDYNGGIILKQRETLTAFKEAFHTLAQREPDLFENFYYAITPIEAQTTLSLSSLKTFFECFLEARDVVFSQPSDSYLKIHEQAPQLYVLLRMPDETIKKSVDPLFHALESQHRVVSFSLQDKKTHLFGYLLSDIDNIVQQQLADSLHHILSEWKSRIDSRQVLRLGLVHPIISLDPRIGGDEVSALILRMLFEGLMRVNREGSLEMGIAKNVSVTEDQKTYFFELRSTFWSNGSPVTAYDFEYAWKKVLSPDFKTPFSYLFYPIKNARRAKTGVLKTDQVGIQALDLNTLKVELEFPSPYFLELTAHTIYSPVNRLVDQIHPNWPVEAADSYVCNGAFKLKKNDPGDGYDLIKNTYYWDYSNIKLEEVQILKTNAIHCYELFQKNIIHWTGSRLGIWDPRFSPEQNDEYVSFPGYLVFWFVFNTQLFPFNHKKIRFALGIGIDRKKMERATQLSTAYSPIPLVYSQVDASILSKYTIEDAKKLFKEALDELNIALEDFPIFSLVHANGSLHNEVAQLIKEDWETHFGIRCRLEPVGLRTLFSRMYSGDFMMGGMTWESWVNDPIYNLNAFRDSKEPTNFPKWENEKYQKIMQIAERETSIEKRYAYFLEAEKLLIDEMPVIPIYQVDAPALKKKKLQVNLLSPLINFKWAYFN